MRILERRFKESTTMSHSHDDALKASTPLVQEWAAVPFPKRKRRFLPYETVFFFSDLVAAGVCFALVTWESTRDFSAAGTVSYFVAVLAFSLVAIGFFPTYNLYSYHRMFSARVHLVNALKSLGWGLTCLLFIMSVYSWPQILGGGAVAPYIFMGAVAVALLSKFLWGWSPNLIRALGISFFLIGIIQAAAFGEAPFFVGQWMVVLAGFFLAAGVIVGVRLFGVSVVFNGLLRRGFRKQVAVVGSDEEAAHVTNHVIKTNAPFWVAGFLGVEPVGHLEIPVAKGQLGRLEDLPRIVAEEGIDNIIVTAELDKAVLISLLDFCTSAGITVWFSRKVLPIINVKLQVDEFCGIPLIRLCSQKNTWLFEKAKYGLDTLITLPALIVLSPVFLLISVLIKLNSPGPVFYRARAVGRGGREFAMLKFRSMRVNNESDIHKQYVTKLIKGELDEQEAREGVFKIKEDPRVTAVGRVLRKYSLDELPQLINVLKGEMSLVGPRPCLPYEYELYESWQRKRLSIRPGISGLWQVAGRSAVTFEDMVILDLYYVYNRSILMDMNILYETIFAVVEKRGAY